VRENTVKSIWERGGATVDARMGIPSSVAAEGMPQAGRVYRFSTILFDSALPVNAAKATGGALREGNVTGTQRIGKSAGGSLH
jgi:hypothetical protein